MTTFHEFTTRRALLTGELIEVVPLANGFDAIQLKCSPPPEVHDRRPSGSTASRVITPEDLQRWEARLLLETRQECLLKAQRVCRFYMWDGTSTFALLHDNIWYGNVWFEESDLTHAIAFRCVTGAMYNQLSDNLRRDRVFDVPPELWQEAKPARR